MSEDAVRRSGRDLIWEAAVELFPKRGYAATSVREIAKAAGVEASLVNRHFGSKEALFLDVMAVHLPIQPLDNPDAPLSELGERLIRSILGTEGEVRELFITLVRAGGTDGVDTRLREIHESLFVRPLRSRLTGEDVELRARLAGALVGGLLYELWLLADDVLAAADQEKMIVRYAALLQQLITA